MEQWRCFLCGGRCIWQNDFDLEDCGYEGQGIVHFYTCSKCGAEYEVREVFEDEECQPREPKPEVDDRQITFEELEI